MVYRFELDLLLMDLVCHLAPVHHLFAVGRHVRKVHLLRYRARVLQGVTLNVCACHR